MSLQDQPKGQHNWKEESRFRKSLNEALIRQADYWNQRSRISWLKDGDKYSNFFFISTIIRNRRNAIYCIMYRNKDWITTRKSIGKEFCGILGEQDVLLRLPDETEIKQFFFTMGSLKAPGPNGMPVLFFKHYWETVGTDFYEVDLDFYFVARSYTKVSMPLMWSSSPKERILKKSLNIGRYRFAIGRQKDADFNFIFKNLVSKLQRWMAKSLLKVGRATLMKSVGLSLPVYSMQTTKFSKRLATKIDGLVENFWWGSDEGNKGLFLRAWDSLSLPKAHGGFGFRKSLKMNQAFLAKWGWKGANVNEIFLYASIVADTICIARNDKKDWIKINCDVRNETETMCMTVVARRHMASFVWIAVNNVPFSNPLISEVAACLLALETSVALGYNFVFTESDSEITNNALRGSSPR
uniref:RNase H type-1 domain-containing protein n=1 Tax=Cannabis sativa TaxID=3483 RepID=A0A803P9N2_CANSA